MAIGARLEFDAPIRGSYGNAAAMAFTVHLREEGQPVSIRSQDVIRVDGRGLIT